MIIESFAVSCTAVGGPADGQVVFSLDTVFGFFPPSAFAEQTGLPPTEPGPKPNVAIEVKGSGLAGPMLVMLDRVTTYLPDGGSHGLGWLRAEKDVDPDDWYFKAHFFQDPVQPGSLGVQAICHLLAWYLTQRGGTAGKVELNQPLAWKYRGQVVPTDTRVTVEVDITAYHADEHGHHATADGWLWVDGRRIYHVSGLGMRVTS